MQAATRHVSVIMTTVPRLSVATDETSCRLPDTGHVRAFFFFLKLRTGLRGRRRGKTDTVGRRWRLAVAGSR